MKIIKMTVNPKQYKNKRNFHKIMNNTVSGSYVTLATQTGSCLAFTRYAKPIVIQYIVVPVRNATFPRTASECYLTAICCSALSFTIFKEILQHKFSLLLKVLYLLSKGFLNIPEYKCLFIGRVLRFYTMENIAYSSL